MADTVATYAVAAVIIWIHCASLIELALGISATWLILALLQAMSSS